MLSVRDGTNAYGMIMCILSNILFMTKNLLLCLPSSLKQFVMNSTKILSSHIYSFFSFCKYIFSLCLGWTLDFERKKADQKPICGVKV